jgi:hypothetical protein
VKEILMPTLSAADQLLFRSHGIVFAPGLLILSLSGGAGAAEAHHTATTVATMLGGEQVRPEMHNMILANLRMGESMLGGAVYADGAGLLLRGCRLEGNQTSKVGGGIYLRNADARIENCVLHENHVHFACSSTFVGGGAIYAIDSRLAVVGTLFDHNWSEGDWAGHAYGGAIVAEGSEIELAGATVPWSCTGVSSAATAWGRRATGTGVLCI